MVTEHSDLTQDQIALERAFLDYARQELQGMRSRLEGMDHSLAGNAVSREALRESIWRRLDKLADDPSVPLFFGRIDCDPALGEPTEQVETTYRIGRRHIATVDRDPVVIDWRAPMGSAFYRASAADPMGIVLRRRYGFEAGELTSYEDERIAEVRDSALSAIVEDEVARPRFGPMRDIVATIQPEQDVVVRAPLAETVCIQGAPGTGKTAVGLHRLAFLLFAYRDQLTRSGVLVVGPNASFLDYIRDVLPMLGELDVPQVTIGSLVGIDSPTEEPAAIARLKGDARMAEVISRAVWAHASLPEEPLTVPVGARRWTVSAAEAGAAAERLRTASGRYDSVRSGLPKALAHLIVVAMENDYVFPETGAEGRLARNKATKDYVAAMLPKIDPRRLLARLLSDPDFLAASAKGILTSEEQELLLWERAPRSLRATPWSLADYLLMDEIADVLTHVTEIGHVVVDEAQDLSPMMLRALGRRAMNGSLTILGDLAQATTPWAVSSWAEVLTHLGKEDGQIEQMTKGFRVPASVLDYSSRLLDHIAPGLVKPVAARAASGRLQVLTDDLNTVVAQVLESPGSIAVITPDARVEVMCEALRGQPEPFAVLGAAVDDAPHRLIVVPATLAKGLEFDHVILEDPAGVIDGEPDRATGLRRLYVCLTRSVSTLVVRHDGVLPPELA